MCPATGWVPTRRGGSETARYLGLALAIGCLLGLVALLTAPALGSVDGGFHQSDNDTEAPRLVGGQSVNETAISLTFADDADVAESAIDVTDFQVEETTVANVTVTENGSNATATLHLASRVDQDELVVSLAPSSDVQDESGNVLDADSEFVGVTVTGMDGIGPAVRSFDVDPTRNGNLELTLGTSESLAAINVSVGGPETVRLTRTDFADPKDLSQYTATVPLSVDGNYTVRIDNVTDRHGNLAPVGRNERVYVDATPPNAVAGIDFGASEGREFVFDASRSTDANGVARLTWVFPGGTNVTGERVTRRFAPGSHTVRLVAVDEAGNVDSDEIVLDFGDDNGTTSAVGNATVAIRRTGTNTTDSAIVDVTDARVGQPVAIGAVDGHGPPLARGAGFAVDGLTLELDTNATYGMAVAAESPGAVADVEGATGATPIGGLTVVHGVADENVANASFTFGVDASTLNETGASPDDVALYRYNDGTWTRLPTDGLNDSGDGFRFRATSPGLSRFAIGVGDGQASGDGNADVVVTEATLNTSSIQPGEAISVEATVVNRASSTKSATVGLSLGGDPVKTRSVELAAGENRTVTFSHAVAEAGEYPVSVGGTMAGSLTVGNASVQGTQSGGSLFGFLSFLPLGFLKTVATFVGIPLLVIYGALKALAIYLGY